MKKDKEYLEMLIARHEGIRVHDALGQAALEQAYPLPHLTLEVTYNEGTRMESSEIEKQAVPIAYQTTAYYSATFPSRSNEQMIKDACIAGEVDAKAIENFLKGVPSATGKKAA